ncbi:MAG: adenylyltransferase/cytidyltransferase family protein [Planctomycetota bacterium]|nr:adenylyltransferase/cytidyltransferase family protein [Planctomycetota bacterium]
MGQFFHSYQSLLDQLAKDRSAGLKIAMTNGAFDLFHVGHLRSFVHAKSLADRLLIAVNTDHSVQVSKGPKRPIHPEAERAELLAALGCVDYVVLFNETTVDVLLRQVKPEVYCKGTDYTPETIPETPTVLAYGGQIAIVGDPKDHSTSEVINRILEAYKPV